MSSIVNRASFIEIQYNTTRRVGGDRDGGLLKRKSTHSFSKKMAIWPHSAFHSVSCVRGGGGNGYNRSNVECSRVPRPEAQHFHE